MHALHGVDGALGRVKSVYMFSRVAKRQRGSKAQFHGRQNFINALLIVPLSRVEVGCFHWLVFSKIGGKDARLLTLPRPPRHLGRERDLSEILKHHSPSSRVRSASLL